MMVSVNIAVQQISLNFIIKTVSVSLVLNVKSFTELVKSCLDGPLFLALDRVSTHTLRGIGVSVRCVQHLCNSS